MGSLGPPETRVTPGWGRAASIERLHLREFGSWFGWGQQRPVQTHRGAPCLGHTLSFDGQMCGVPTLRWALGPEGRVPSGACPPGAHSVLGLRGADRHIDQQQCKTAETPGPGDWQGHSPSKGGKVGQGDSSGSAGMKLRAHEGRSMREAGSRSSLLGR